MCVVNSRYLSILYSFRFGLHVDVPYGVRACVCMYVCVDCFFMSGVSVHVNVACESLKLPRDAVRAQPSIILPLALYI